MSAAADVIEQAGIEMMGNIFGFRGYAARTKVAFYAACKIPLSGILFLYGTYVYCECSTFRFA